MVESELRKQERLRSRKRNQFAVWSVIPAAGVVVLVGGLFWASVWLVFRPSVTTAPTVADAPAAEAQLAAPIDGFAPPVVDEAAVIADGAFADRRDDDALADRQDDDGPTIADAIGEPPTVDAWAADHDPAAAPTAARTWINPDGSVVAIVEPPADNGRVTDAGVADDWAAGDRLAVSPPAGDPVMSDPVMGDPVMGDSNEPRETVATNDLIASSEWVVADSPTTFDDPSVVGDLQAQVYDADLGPVHGPFLAEIGDEQGLADAVAAAEASDPFFIAQQATELAARNAELTARAQELASRAEDLTGRLEGLTAKIEELETRLSTTGANLLAHPALVPSPQPLSNGRGPEVVAARATATPAPAGTGTRAPWVVMPQPEPGSRVAAGSVILETRARGEAPITQIRLQLDGVALQVSLDRRDDSTWRGRTTARVGPGQHTVAVSVVDAQGRTGSYRWQFNATS